MRDEGTKGGKSRQDVSVDSAEPKPGAGGRVATREGDTEREGEDDVGGGDSSSACLPLSLLPKRRAGVDVDDEGRTEVGK